MPKEFEYDPETGETQPVKPKAPKLKVPPHLRYSRFVDESESGVFNVAVSIGTDAFFAREMSEQLLDSVTERMAEQETLQMRLATVFKGNDQAAIKKGQAQMLGALKEQRAMFTEVLEQTLVGWTLARPFTPEAIKALSVSTRAQIAREVVKSSQVGSDEADFLAKIS